RPLFDGLLEVEIRLWLDTARGAQGGDAIGQVKTWRRKTHLGRQPGTIVTPVRAQIWPQVEPQMAMHPDDARHHRVAAQVKHRDVGTLSHVRPRLDRRDLAIFD